MNTDDKTKTPRTDAAAFDAGHPDDGFAKIDVVETDFARTLERENSKLITEVCAANQENAALRQRVEELNGRVACLKNSLKRAAELLEEVRTGEDFEAVCWEAAEEFRQQLRALLSQPSQGAARDKGVGL